MACRFTWKCIPTSSEQVPATAADETQAFLSPLSLIFPAPPAGWLGGPLRLQRDLAVSRSFPALSQGLTPSLSSHVDLTLGGTHRRNSFQQLKPLIPYPLEILALILAGRHLCLPIRSARNKDFFLPFCFFFFFFPKDKNQWTLPPELFLETVYAFSQVLVFSILTTHVIFCFSLFL